MPSPEHLLLGIWGSSIVIFVSLFSHQGVLCNVTFTPGGSCENDTCFTGAFICDSDVLCRFTAGTACNGAPSFCLLAGTCENNQLCKLNVRENCSTSDPQCASGMECDANSNTCLLLAGESCAGANNESCTTGTVCQNDMCRLILDETCSVSNPNYCENDLFCDGASDQCKRQPGGNCSADVNQCSSNTTCENDVCKANAGESCAGAFSSHCVAGSMCENDICKLEVKEACSSSSDNCASGSSCDGGFCKFDLGGNCSGNNSDACRSDLICDSTQEICKIGAGGSCIADKNSCNTGTACDLYVCRVTGGGGCAGALWSQCGCGTACENDVCKLDAGQSCSGTMAGHCRNGTTCDTPSSECRVSVGEDCTDYWRLCQTGAACDTTNICRVRVGEACTVTSDCVQNAACSSTCQCNDGYAHSSSSGECFKSDGLVIKGSSVLLILAVLIGQQLSANS